MTWLRWRGRRLLLIAVWCVNGFRTFDWEKSATVGESREPDQESAGIRKHRVFSIRFIRDVECIASFRAIRPVARQFHEESVVCRVRDHHVLEAKVFNVARVIIVALIRTPSLRYPIDGSIRSEHDLCDQLVEFTHVNSLAHLDLDVTRTGPELEFSVEVKRAGVLGGPHVSP
ncbi:hypothetical protein RCH23_002796 [Cryobacterium sp. CAN_C3]|nr:hypothetical protein [Cryobacterium sp. CAN_C3]